jgi:membrane protein implicated in regulation of membrane protease activity
MADWAWWLISAGVLAAGEVATLGFFLGPLALAALLAAVIAVAGVGLELQLAVFIAASAASLLVVRPLARRHMRMPAQLRTGTAALVGQRALVLETVDEHGGKVRIGGEVWSARAYDEDHVLEPGARVDVLKIEGATALVSE